MKISEAKVVEQAAVTEEYRVLTLEVPAISSRVKPGQFVHMRVPRLHDAVLRRPFSVYRADEKHLKILYKRVGHGTEALNRVDVGEEVNLMGPLGNGFPLDIEDGKTPLLVAGGYGVAPLYMLAKQLPKTGVLFIGGRTSADILCADEFRSMGWEVLIATDDGSVGIKGLVTAAIDGWRQDNKDAEVEYFACGPDGMLKAVGNLAIASDSRGWLSLDKHMGCGTGACLACVQKIKASDGSVKWGRVCKDGPVFESREIVWQS